MKPDIKVWNNCYDLKIWIKGWELQKEIYKNTQLLTREEHMKAHEIKKEIKCNNCWVAIDEEDWICKKCEENIRICNCCWDAMSEGYIYNDENYCCWGCLPIAISQFEEEYTEDWDNCYTEWSSIFYD